MDLRNESRWDIHQKNCQRVWAYLPYLFEDGYKRALTFVLYYDEHQGYSEGREKQKRNLHHVRWNFQSSVLQSIKFDI